MPSFFLAHDSSIMYLLSQRRQTTPQTSNSHYTTVGRL